MKIAIVYPSTYGHTKLHAEVICKGDRETAKMFGRRLRKLAFNSFVGEPLERKNKYERPSL